ncbi:gluconate 2-dehydrogenase subunit 3 family protein (plasmid) [Azospirillum sp. A26]|uniref:gluconate 2-dehydrogenase subunit 3 family protein n=1 Tax=Azospirillum sp. A26 TaxID=3160607 RepID=UPI0036722D08
MSLQVIKKDTEYVFNHCTKLLARDNEDARHSFFGTYDGQSRQSISECWRLPIIDAHDGGGADAGEWNDVTFVYAPPGGARPEAVSLVCTAHRLNEPLRLESLDGSRFFALSAKVPRGRRFRYLFVVDDRASLDPINPQVETLPNGDVWSSFFTWSYAQPVSFEPWEYAILDRLVRHILPFNSDDAINLLARGADENKVDHLYRLDISVGVANFIDKLVAREERHRLDTYKTCLEMIDGILRRRHQGRDPALVEESAYVQLYGDLAVGAPSLFEDGWDRERYGNPSYFLWLLRRHAWTGAFSHPKYGGNPGGMAWDYLAERFRSTADPAVTAFAWRQAIEPPLGTSAEYRG